MDANDVPRREGDRIELKSSLIGLDRSMRSNEDADELMVRSDCPLESAREADP